MSVKKLCFEVCANSLLSALNAQLAGADRIELCQNLEVGGTTPAKEVILETRKQLHLPIHVLIRPRAGDFCYSAAEFKQMKLEVKTCKELEVDGIVTGILHHDLTIDQTRCAELIELAHPLSVTFHRAFDVVVDPFQSLTELISLGVDRILTSGQQEDAGTGVALIKKLVDAAKDRIVLLAGGGITEDNILKIVKESGTSEFHFSAKSMVGGSYISDPHRIRRICDLARSASQSIDQ